MSQSFTTFPLWDGVTNHSGSASPFFTSLEIIHFCALTYCSPIFSPLAYRDPLHCNMNRLFVMLLKDSLTEYAYDAELAGLKYEVDIDMYGISVSISP